MRYQQVAGSSQIEAVAYDATEKVLRIRFVGGSAYQYSHVPPHVVLEMLFEGKSIGSQFTRLIKSNPQAYPYEKLEVVQQ